MALRNTSDGTLLGYSAAIAAAISNDDDALLDLVEDIMRGRTEERWTVSRPEFAYLARQSLGDVLRWHQVGAVEGMTLADYCAALGLTYPACLDKTARLR